MFQNACSLFHAFQTEAASPGTIYSFLPEEITLFNLEYACI